MNPDDDAPKAKSAHGGVLGLAKSVVTAGADLAGSAMQGGPSYQRTVVFICWIVLAVSVLVISIPPYSAVKQTVTLIVMVIAVTMIAVLTIRHRPRSAGATDAPNDMSGALGMNEDGPKGPPANDSTADAPALINLPVSVFPTVRELLERARSKSCSLLSEKNPQLSDKQVRATIFVPMRTRNPNNDDLILGIYDGLHINMDGPAEQAIELDFDQGLTGMVFSRGTLRVAQRLEGGKRDWDEWYQLNPEMEEIVHPNLKWILSMPVHSKNGRPIAVLNIDGLVHQFATDDLYSCVRPMIPELATLAPFFERYSIHDGEEHK